MRASKIHRMLIAGAFALCCGVMAAASAPAPAQPAAPATPPAAPAPPAAGQAPSAEAIAAARADFLDVARVLLSPRCRNCHPAGDAPLHGDQGVPHSMNITRRTPAAGVPCTTCHRERNAPLAGGPPGVPDWHMPPAEMPMVFEGKTPRALCLQLVDPAHNGGKSLHDLVAHVRDDRLVHWGWNPGPGRSLPPLPHAAFVAKVQRWAEAGGPCPE